MLPQTSQGPLHCASASDIYLILKSSDFVSHGIDPSRAYAYGDDLDVEDQQAASEDRQAMTIELVLKRFTEVNPSREVRCFVRDNVLLGEWQSDFPSIKTHGRRLAARHQLLRASAEGGGASPNMRYH